MHTKCCLTSHSFSVEIPLCWNYLHLIWVLHVNITKLIHPHTGVTELFFWLLIGPVWGGGSRRRIGFLPLNHPNVQRRSLFKFNQGRNMDILGQQAPWSLVAKQSQVGITKDLNACDRFCVATFPQAQFTLTVSHCAEPSWVSHSTIAAGRCHHLLMCSTCWDVSCMQKVNTL